MTHTMAGSWYVNCIPKYANAAVRNDTRTARKSSRAGGRVWSNREPPLSVPKVLGECESHASNATARKTTPTADDSAKTTRESVSRAGFGMTSPRDQFHPTPRGFINKSQVFQHAVETLSEFDLLRSSRSTGL